MNKNLNYFESEAQPSTNASHAQPQEHKVTPPAAAVADVPTLDVVERKDYLDGKDIEPTPAHFMCEGCGVAKYHFGCHQIDGDTEHQMFCSVWATYRHLPSAQIPMWMSTLCAYCDMPLTHTNFDHTLGFPGEGPTPIMEPSLVSPRKVDSRDVARRERHLRNGRPKRGRAVLKRKRVRKFDSTKGYPGEGPPRSRLKKRVERKWVKKITEPKEARPRQEAPFEALTPPKPQASAYAAFASLEPHIVVLREVDDDPFEENHRPQCFRGQLETSICSAAVCVRLPGALAKHQTHCHRVRKKHKPHTGQLRRIIESQKRDDRAAGREEKKLDASASQLLKPKDAPADGAKTRDESSFTKPVRLPEYVSVMCPLDSYYCNHPEHCHPGDDPLSATLENANLNGGVELSTTRAGESNSSGELKSTSNVTNFSTTPVVPAHAETTVTNEVPALHIDVKATLHVDRPRECKRREEKEGSPPFTTFPTEVLPPDVKAFACGKCGISKPKEAFSAKQFKKKGKRKCQSCVELVVIKEKEKEELTLPPKQYEVKEREEKVKPPIVPLAPPLAVDEKKELVVAHPAGGVVIPAPPPPPHPDVGVVEVKAPPLELKHLNADALVLMHFDTAPFAILDNDATPYRIRLPTRQCQADLDALIDACVEDYLEARGLDHTWPRADLHSALELNLPRQDIDYMGVLKIHWSSILTTFVSAYCFNHGNPQATLRHFLASVNTADYCFKEVKRVGQPPWGVICEVCEEVKDHRGEGAAVGEHSRISRTASGVISLRPCVSCAKPPRLNGYDEKAWDNTRIIQIPGLHVPVRELLQLVVLIAPPPQIPPPDADEVGGGAGPQILAIDAAPIKSLKTVMGEVHRNNELPPFETLVEVKINLAGREGQLTYFERFWSYVQSHNPFVTTQITRHDVDVDQRMFRGNENQHISHPWKSFNGRAELDAHDIAVRTSSGRAQHVLIELPGLLTRTAHISFAAYWALHCSDKMKLRNFIFVDEQGVWTVNSTFYQACVAEIVYLRAQPGGVGLDYPVADLKSVFRHHAVAVRDAILYYMQVQLQEKMIESLSVPTTITNTPIFHRARAL